MRRELGLVAIGWVAVALTATVWLAIDRRPPEWDHANHLERALLCTGDLRAGDVRAILERSSFYPPLAPCLAGAFGLVLPPDAAATAALVVFLGLGMLAVYLLGRRLSGGPTGVAAALLFGGAPFVVYSTLLFQLDLPLAAMVALALVALLASEHFTRLGGALAVGVVCGLGLLTKPTFVIYVLPPALALALLGLGRGWRRALPGIALATLVAAALSLPWFGPRLFGLGAQVDARAFAQAEEAGHPDPFTLTALTFYVRWLGYQFGLLTAVLALAGLVVAAIRRQWFLLIAALTPFVALEVIRNKNLRYSLPIAGALAVLAALSLDVLPARARRVAAVVLVVAGVVQVSAMATGVPPNTLLPWLQTWWVPSAVASRADWRHHDILSLLERDWRGAPATVLKGDPGRVPLFPPTIKGDPGRVPLFPPTVSVVPNFAVFSVSNFRYYALRDGFAMRFVRAWDDPPLGIEYMILKTGNVGPSWTAEKSRRVGDRLAADPNLARVFPVIGEFPLPDGSVASVRARRIPPLTGVPPAAVAAAVEGGLRRRLGEVARDVDGLEVRLTYDDGILAGRVARAEVRAAAATLGELNRPGTSTLRVHDLRVVLQDLLVNPWSARESGRFDPLDLGKLRLESATVTIPDLQAFVAGLKRFHRSTVTADGDALAVAVRQSGPDVTARVRLTAAADRPFALRAERVRVGGVPVPAVLVNWVIRNFDPTPKIATRVPFPVEIGRVSVQDQALRISEGSR
ncbi:MAG TPA: glycosyltransferase family 39 protein [Candidatus Binatia bacterium]|nr:glycosyltransferase family 39 protein [Candidatus Binatia bacterium]